MNTSSGTLAILLLATAAAEAQQHQHPAATAPPATLVAGMGSLHHAIATKNADAQRFFDQGLTFVYGFNHDEAIRSFRRAAELDPASPMPHWGIALALGPNINLDVDPEREKAAYDEAQQALALAARAPAAERAYVDALVERYSNDPKADLKALAVKYKDAMRDLVRAVSRRSRRRDALRGKPDGPAPVAALVDRRQTRPKGTEEIVAVLESRAAPRSPCTSAPTITTSTPSRRRRRRIARSPSAKRLDTLVPAAGHLVHMPAHIYMRTGDYDAAVTSNAKAARSRSHVHRRHQSRAASTR